ncbi:MAG: DcaP family trimeric outer membrane transporter [Flavisolibacter sp.]
MLMFRCFDCTKFLFSIFLITSSTFLSAQENKNSFEIYGSIFTDVGYDFNTIDPLWFDVMRPTKLPSFENEFAPGGNIFYSIRQTKFGVKSSVATGMGVMTTQFDFDFIGFGKNAGQTTFHVVNAYGELGHFGAGQTASAFMNLDVFPETLDYWGPLSRVFYLNIQLRYIPVKNENSRVVIALERPGGTSDGGDYKNAIELQGIKPVFKYPNLTMHYRRTASWGHIQLAGIAKSMKWEDVSDTSIYKLAGSALGWGFNISSVIKASRNLTLKVQGVYGNGMENYIADAGADIGLESNPGDIYRPFTGKALPVWGFFSFVEILWNKSLRSSAGYAFESINNSDLQSANAFHHGQYGLINLRYSPIKYAMVAIEYQYGRRDNFKDGFHSTGNKIQFQCRVNFSQVFTQPR